MDTARLLAEQVLPALVPHQSSVANGHSVAGEPSQSVVRPVSSSTFPSGSVR
jgi:hypothetical protein